MPELLLERPTVVEIKLEVMESRVLLHLAHGVRRLELPEAIGRSLWSVDALLDGLYKKLDQRSATGAVVAGHELGLLPREAYATPRLYSGEPELLGLIGARLSNQQIMARLGLPSTSTLAKRIQRLYQGLGARNRPSAVHVGFCTGLLGGDLA